MGSIRTFIHMLKHSRGRIADAVVNKLNHAGMLNWISDRQFLKLKYRVALGKKLNLKMPKTFNEKLQWMKLYNRDTEYCRLVDKYDVKSCIAEKIGAEYLIPTLGIWDHFEDIDFDTLPDQFVLKCTHDSGSVVLCYNKESFDVEFAKKKLTKKLSENLFWHGREWPYKNLKPRIIAEQFLEGDCGVEIPDYKFHCFNGEPKLILVCKDRFSDTGLTEDFFDANWEHIPVKRPYHGFSKSPITQPENLDKMLELARQLAKDIPFVRVDFYEVDHKIYFGEMTFFPASGFVAFEPESWDETLGSWIKLPQKMEN